LLLAWIFAAPAAQESGAAETAGDRVVVAGRAGGVGLSGVVAAALLVHFATLRGRLYASRVVRTTGAVAQLAIQSGAADARRRLEDNLAPLRRAAELDPLDVNVALTTGSHYLLLGSEEAAIESYQHGLAIEPRAELYLNLARALALAGRRDQAVEYAADAVTLNPRLDDDAAALGLR
jgi:tetratricopeptide (TPR) repeat protein